MPFPDGAAHAAGAAHGAGAGSSQHGAGASPQQNSIPSAAAASLADGVINVHSSM